MENPYTHGTIHIQYKYNTYTYKQNTKKQNESDDIDMLPSFDTEYPEPQYKDLSLTDNLSYAKAFVPKNNLYVYIYMCVYVCIWVYIYTCIMYKWYGTVPLSSGWWYFSFSISRMEQLEQCVSTPFVEFVNRENEIDLMKLS